MLENLIKRFTRSDAQEAPAMADNPMPGGEVRNDSLSGVMMPNYWRYMLGIATPLSAIDLYSTSGIAARLVDMPAEDAVAAGFRFEDEEADAALRAIGGYQAIINSTKWARATGAGAILVIVSDGRKLDQPLGNVRAIVRLLTLDAYQISDDFGQYYEDPTLAKYGEPTHYLVTINGRQLRIHESRLIKVRGYDRPPSAAAVSGLSWLGISEIERNEKAILKYDDALTMTVGMLERKHQPVLKMAGLAEAMQLGVEGQAIVKRRVDTLDEIRGFRNTIAVDGADDFSAVDLNMSGVAENIKLVRENLCASSGIPVSILFGASASGLATTNEADQDQYGRYIQRVQQVNILPSMKALLRMLGKGEEIEPFPVFVPSETESAEVREKDANTALKYAQTAQTLVATGVASERVARAWVAMKVGQEINGKQ